MSKEDKRFSASSWDPRFQTTSKASKKHVVKDKRFTSMFTDPAFASTDAQLKVDKFGRPISRAEKKSKDVHQYYEHEEEDDEPTMQTKNKKKNNKKNKSSSSIAPVKEDVKPQLESSEDEDTSSSEDDTAAVEAMVETSSSSSDESSSEDSSAEESVEEEPLPMVAAESVSSTRIAVNNLEWDRIRAVDILVMLTSFLPKGGSIECVTVYPSEFGRSQMAKEAEMGPSLYYKDDGTKRPADDDAYLQKYSDEEEDEDGLVFEEMDEEDFGNDDDEPGLTKLASSSSSSSSSKSKGKQPEVDEDKYNDLSDEDEDVDTTKMDEFDMEKLRQYELTRLKYYYAVVEFDTPETALAIYQECDGMEFESSSNMLDLRFIPNEITFDQEPRDEASSIPSRYVAPSNWYTAALQHSKVHLTWDRDDPSRRAALRQDWKESTLGETEETIALFLGSGSDTGGSGSDAVVSMSDSEGDGERVTLKKKSRAKYSSLLASLKSDSDSDDMNMEGKEIVFRGGLQQAGRDLFKNAMANKDKSKEEPSAWEKSRQAQKDKKKARKAAKKAAEQGNGLESSGDEGDSEEERVKAAMADDDFFADAYGSDMEDGDAKKKPKKTKKKKKKDNKIDDEIKADPKAQAELELLMMDENVEKKPQGYNLNDLLKAEKEKGKKKKKKKKKAKEEEYAPDDFKVDAADPRFGAMFEDPSYQLDPTNAQFKATAGGKALLEETRNRQKRRLEDEAAAAASSKAQKKRKPNSDVGYPPTPVTPANSIQDMSALVASVKAKSKTASSKRLRK